MACTPVQHPCTLPPCSGGRQVAPWRPSARVTAARRRRAVTSGGRGASSRLGAIKRRPPSSSSICFQRRPWSKLSEPCVQSSEGSNHFDAEKKSLSARRRRHCVQLLVKATRHLIAVASHAARAACTAFTASRSPRILGRPLTRHPHTSATVRQVLTP